MILYLHGFNSSPLSTKARQLAAYCAERGLYCVVPALPADPRAALAQISALLADGREHLLVGSSLGGYYAIHFVETTSNARAVLVNPALAVADKLAPLVGEKQQNYHSGETYIFTEAHRAALAEIEIAPSKWANYLALLQTGDEVLDCREAATAFAPSNPVIEEGGDHSFTTFADYLPRIAQFAGRAGEIPDGERG